MLSNAQVLANPPQTARKCGRLVLKRSATVPPAVFGLRPKISALAKKARPHPNLLPRGEVNNRRQSETLNGDSHPAPAKPPPLLGGEGRGEVEPFFPLSISAIKHSAQVRPDGSRPRRATVHGCSKVQLFQAQGKTGNLQCFSLCCDCGRSHSYRRSAKIHPPNGSLAWPTGTVALPRP